MRDKKQKKWTTDHETAAKLDRENVNEYVEYPSSMSPQYMDYIRHSMKFFNEGVELYGTRKYSRLHLDKHIRTQQAMDSIVHTLTDDVQNGRILVCIEGKPFNPSSPIQKYRRCPGIRKIYNHLKKVPTCDVLFVDEYNTSKACGCCQRKFDQPKHKYWDRRKIRHRVCDDCHPNSNIINLPKTIVAPKPRRQLQMEKLKRRCSIFQQHGHISWTETSALANLNCDLMTDEDTHNRFEKVPFDATKHQSVQKIVWNRDISAARNMIIKGICSISNRPTPPNLMRSHQAESDTDDEQSS